MNIFSSSFMGILLIIDERETFIYPQYAYKIFFIILELISDYQLSSLLIILFSGKGTSKRGAFSSLLFLNIPIRIFNFPC